jgi:hypothetical protein
LQRRLAEAKSVCRQCPVAAHCMALALKANEPYGVWGGLDADERSAARRRIGERGLLRLPRKVVERGCSRSGSTSSGNRCEDGDVVAWSRASRHRRSRVGDQGRDGRDSRRLGSTLNRVGDPERHPWDPQR